MSNKEVFSFFYIKFKRVMRGKKVEDISNKEMSTLPIVVINVL